MHGGAPTGTRTVRCGSERTRSAAQGSATLGWPWPSGPSSSGAWRELRGRFTRRVRARARAVWPDAVLGRGTSARTAVPRRSQRRSRSSGPRARAVG
eukprot:10910619-Alexandrium_andersonii.AAC.1